MKDIRKLIQEIQLTHANPDIPAQHLTVDVELSERLAKLVGPERHQCYHNSFKALAYLPEGTTYCEGQGYIEGLVPLEHGFLLLPDSKTVVDVSWTGIGGKVTYAYWLRLTQSEINQIVDIADGRLLTLPFSPLFRLPSATVALAAINRTTEMMEKTNENDGSGEPEDID